MMNILSTACLTVSENVTMPGHRILSRRRYHRFTTFHFNSLEKPYKATASFNLLPLYLAESFTYNCIPKNKEKLINHIVLRRTVTQHGAFILRQLGARMFVKNCFISKAEITQAIIKFKNNHRVERRYILKLVHLQRIDILSLFSSDSDAIISLYHSYRRILANIILCRRIVLAGKCAF